MVTPIGRFQFILGREIGVAFYGSVQGADAFLVPDSRLMVHPVSVSAPSSRIPQNRAGGP